MQTIYLMCLLNVLYDTNYLHENVKPGERIQQLPRLPAPPNAHHIAYVKQFYCNSIATNIASGIHIILSAFCAAAPVKGLGVAVGAVTVHVGKIVALPAPRGWHASYRLANPPTGAQRLSTR